LGTLGAAMGAGAGIASWNGEATEPNSWYSLVLVSSWMSKADVEDEVGVAGVWESQVGKLAPRFRPPWRLRRFATGLPALDWSTLMASVRFSGLMEMVAKESALPLANFVTPVLGEPEPSKSGIEWRDCFSRCLRVTELIPSAKSRNEGFSWPRTSGSEAGGAIELPESGEGPKTRFKGLLGDARIRLWMPVEEGLDRAERSDNLTLGG